MMDGALAKGLLMLEHSLWATCSTYFLRRRGSFRICLVHNFWS